MLQIELHNDNPDMLITVPIKIDIMRNKKLGRKFRYAVREFAYTLYIWLFLAGKEVGG